MSDLTKLLENYSLADIVIIGLLIYASGKWLLGQIQEWKNKSDEQKKKYHETETAKDKNNKDLQDRLDTIETKLAKDYERIQKSESHLYQIENSMHEINNLVIEMRIQSLRKQILDFTDKAVNMTNPNISREAYSEIDRIYHEYEDLLKKIGKENGYIDYSYRCILHSLEKREENKLFLEDFYIAPSEVFNKMKGSIKENNKTDN